MVLYFQIHKKLSVPDYILGTLLDTVPRSYENEELPEM
jgi:hypothetical protein